MNVPPVQMLTAGIDSSFDGITSLASSQQETGPSLSPQPISSPDQITPTRVLFFFLVGRDAGDRRVLRGQVNLHFALRLRRSRQADKMPTRPAFLFIRRMPLAPPVFLDCSLPPSM